MGTKASIRWSKKITPCQVQQLIRAERDVKRALLVFDAATAEYVNGFKHDHTTYGLIISRLASANQFRSAEMLLYRMKEEECKITENIFLSICKAYSQAHKPLDALRIFNKMKEFQCEPTPKSYLIIFDILVSENRLKMAQDFYKHMTKAGIPPSVGSFNILLKALCKSSRTLDAAFKVFEQMPVRGFVPDCYTYGTLINGLCRLGQITKARKLLLEMEKKDCSPSVVTYSSLIHGLCLSNCMDEALEMLNIMSSKNIKPNVITYSSLMDGLCKRGRSSEAMGLLEKMVNQCLLPNNITYSSLIDGLCKEGKLQEALEILDRMKLQGYQPDAGLYSKFVNGLCESCKFHEAANYLDEMILSGVFPSRFTKNVHFKMYNTVVKGLCSQNSFDRAFQVYRCMQTRCISTEHETFHILVVSFCRKGDLHKSAHIVNEMVLSGHTPGEATWTAIIGGFWARRKVREAAELMQNTLIKQHAGLNGTILS
ncbi:pentatricopeptide repeat-containing protein At5g46100-like isoform X2 [Aristolochia californica]